MIEQSRVRPSRVSESRTRVSARIGARFGSPFVLAISVLGLVLVVGCVATLSSYASLCRAGREHARRDLLLQSTRLEASLSQAFSLSDALLDRLLPHVESLAPSDDPAPLLRALYELSTERPGLAWMSMSFDDGTFVGVYRDAQGKLRAQDSRITSEGGIERQLSFTAHGALVEDLRRTTSYDPRTRPFYSLAVAHGARVWTPPYPFLPSLRTGITRAQPIYRDTPQGRTLVGVATVDFDATALAELLVAPSLRSHRLVVATAEGAVMASRGAAAAAAPVLSGERALGIDQVRDPALLELFADRERLLRDGEGSFESEGQRFYGNALRVGRLGASDVLLLSAVDERELYGEATRQALRGIAVTGVVAMLALALAAAISANIARLRQARVRAEQDAEAARDEVRALGSYELAELLGSGGMGDVYRAKHRLLARDAALKLIRPHENAADVTLGERFMKEAQRLASMRSIHTVSVYDFGIAEDGSYYLVMELLEGLDLHTLVKRHGRQPPARVASIMAQVCESLAEAHAAGLVHQDIKPANIFLCRLADALDVVKVLDFGIARMIEARASEPPSREGTPAFMSPEQVLGEPVGPAADLYALGCVGHFMLTGRFPYRADTVEQLHALHVEGELPRLPDDVAEKTPPALVQLLIRCMAKRPEHRPASAEALGQALRAVADAAADTFTPENRGEFWRRFDALRAGCGAIESERAAPSTRTLPARVYNAQAIRGPR